MAHHSETNGNAQSLVDTDNEINLTLTKRKREARIPFYEFTGLKQQRVGDVNTLEIRKRRSTLQIYSTLAGINKPYRLLIDGTVIIQGFTLEELRSFFEDPEAEVFTTACVKKELAILANYIDLTNMKTSVEKIQNTWCSHEGDTFHHDCLIRSIGPYNDEKFIVVTDSDSLYDLLNEGIIKVPVLELQNGKLLLKSPSLLGKTVDYEKLMSGYRRLKHRIEKYRFVAKQTGVGGESLFGAVAELLSLESPKRVREEVAEQLEYSKKHYTRSAKENCKLSVVDISEPGSWGNDVVLQAISDLYKVRVVVLLSYQDQIFFEWWPASFHYNDRMKVIFLSYLDGYRYGALYRPNQVKKELILEEDFSVDFLYKKCGPRLDSLRYKVGRGNYNFDVNETEFSLRKRLERRLETYLFSEKVVAGDGNCCFRALALNLEGSEEKHDIMREEICNQLRDYPASYREPVYNEYVLRMSMPRTWGDCSVLQSCADLRECNIFSLSSAKEEVAYEYHYNGFKASHCKDVYLADCGWHNNAIAPRNI